MTGRWVVTLTLLLWASASRATLLVPMSDEDLVGSSDLIALGTVAEVRTVLLGGDRIVTRVTLAVERALKGGPASDTLVVTEAGGSIGGRRVAIFGSPEYATGEHVLVFLRLGRDGSLHTNALALGKYTIEEPAGSPARARRALPTMELRALEPFVARVGALVAGQSGAATDGRAGAAVAPSDLEVVTGAFMLAPGQGGVPARWFEADCAQPIAFSRANADDALPAESTTALAEAFAAWTAVDGASITLTEGPDTTPTRSIVSGTFDGRNVVQFNDPFAEVEDLVNCTGVLARGGFAGGSDEQLGLRQTVDGVTFGRIFEGDVVVNQGTGACIGSESGLAEVLAHEIGHAIGFGHSSEDPNEPDPVLRDALMYFRARNDGRGAAVRQDDIAGLQSVYPSSREATTAVGTFACEVGLGPMADACFGRSFVLAPFTLFKRSAAAARRAEAAASPRKRKKQLRAARRFLRLADAAIARRITGECGAAMRATVARRLDEVSALLATP